MHLYCLFLTFSFSPPFINKMDDPGWLRSCASLTKSLNELERRTSIIRRSTNKVITIKDINKEREKVKQTTSVANSTDVQGIQDELRLMERFIQLNPSLNMEGAKLMEAAGSALQQYQRARDDFFQKCIQVEEANRSKQSSLSNRAFADDADESGEADALLQAGTETQRVQFERDLRAEIMAERQRETQQIAENVKDINEIFQHMNQLIGEQGVQLEMVDNNITRAEEATRRANQHLQQAHSYQESNCGNKALFILVLILVFVVLLSFILG